jgi:membrane protein DedA with SNARE-associated domain
LIWNSLLLYVGFYLGSKWQEVAEISHYIVIAVAVIVIVLFTLFLIRRRNKNRKPQAV